MVETIAMSYRKLCIFLHPRNSILQKLTKLRSRCSCLVIVFLANCVFVLLCLSAMVTLRDRTDMYPQRDMELIADDLRDKIRVLCWVLTSPSNLVKKTAHARNTWGKRCTKTLYMSSETDHDFPTIGLNVSEGREHLTSKTMAALRYIYENHYQDFDWFLKADDDTYVIVENLRYFLSDKEPVHPVYFGHRYNYHTRQGYCSGGAGYVLSRAALAVFYSGSSRCSKDGGDEDVAIGRCMALLRIRAGVSTDKFDRSRFHPFKPSQHAFPIFREIFYKHDPSLRKSFMSDYAITFHYVSPSEMYMLEYLIYHLHTYGIIRGLQETNTSISTFENVMQPWENFRLPP